MNKELKPSDLFQIIYSHEQELYDFTVIDIETKEVIYHYHFETLEEINKLIEEYK